MGIRERISLVFVVVVAAVACATPTGSKKLTDTERARLLVEVANAALLERDPIGALDYLGRAEKLDGDLPELHHSRALAYFARKELAMAIESAERATDLMPEYSEANNTLGKLLMDVGRYQDARLYLKRAAGDPLYREAYKAQTNLGILYYRLGKFDLSMSSLNKAIGANGELACVAHYYRGMLYQRDKAFNQALKDYRAAVKQRCGSFEKAHYAIGVAYAKAGRYDEARKKFLEVQKLFKGSDIARRAMARFRELP